METFWTIVKRTIASLLILAAGGALMFFVLRRYDASGMFLLLEQYAYELLALGLALVVANVARDFDHRIAKVLTGFGVAVPLVAIGRYLLVIVLQVPSRALLMVTGAVAVVTVLWLIRGDRVRFLSGMLLLPVIALMIAFVIPDYEAQIDLDVILQQQTIVLFTLGEDRENLSLERKEENQTRFKSLSEGQDTIKLSHLPQEIHVGGSTNASAVLLLPDRTAITFSSPSSLQFTGVGWQIRPEGAIFDRSMSAKQGGAQECQDCYADLFTQTLISTVQKLYGNTRADTPLLRKLQYSKARIFSYFEENRYNQILKNMKRYDYFLGKWWHIPDGDALWKYFPTISQQQDPAEQEVDYAPILETTKKNSETGFSKTRYFKKRFD